ncbi:MAG: PHP domain-containing protein [Dehalococcoidia bacterium]
MNDARPLHVDLHTHTHHSPDSLISPRRLVEACHRKGIDCVAVTDHNSIRGALAVRELADFPVIIGEEIRTDAGEIIALFLNEEVPRGLSAEETIERVKGQGGLVGVPHPYDQFRSALRHEEMERLAGRLDFIEALNARIVFPDNNGQARRFARKHGLAVSAGSDAHSPGELGGAYVEMRGFDGPPDFLEALRAGSLIGKLSSPLVHLWTRYAVLRRKLGWRPV